MLHLNWNDEIELGTEGYKENTDELIVNSLAIYGNYKLLIHYRVCPIEMNAEVESSIALYVKDEQRQKINTLS